MSRSARNAETSCFIDPEQARKSPGVKQTLNAIGQAVSTDSLEEATVALRSEAQQWKHLIAERGIKFGN